MFRNILAVIVGMIAWGGLWVTTGVILNTAMPNSFAEDGTTSDPTVLGIFIAVSVMLSLLAGWLCALIGRGRVMIAVLVLGLIHLVIGIMVQTSVWDQMPLWYHLIFLAAVVPAHLIGGWIKAGGATPRNAPSFA